MDPCNLLELPLDVVRVIWSYLDLPDVIRFGTTAKNMLDKIWPFYQHIATARNWPCDALTFVIARDLTHARELELSFSPDEDDFKSIDEINMQKIALLATKKAPNLIELVTDLDVPVTSSHSYENMLKSVKEFISSHTQLQKLLWYTARLESDFNIGQFLSNHTRLTELSVQTEQRLSGFNLLTQLKNLNISFCDTLDDDMFADAIQLTQLTRLFFIFQHTISDRTFTEITKLTNLEQLGVCQELEMKSSNMTVLYKLPKLSYLRFSPLSDQTQYSEAVSIIARLSKLTALQIDGSWDLLDLGQLATLTKLQHMQLRSRLKNVDFSSFQNLTSLILVSTPGIKLRSLPPNLKQLSIANTDISEEDIKFICNMNHLGGLELLRLNFDTKLMAIWITQLTSLTSLTVRPTASKELISALEKLPNLATLHFNNVPKDIVDDLAKLTQLMTLTYWEDYTKALQQKLPFRICNS